MEGETLLTFTVASWRLALPLADVKRVLPLPVLEPPLGGPSFVEGFFDYQGAPVAALRLDRMFGLEEEDLGVYSPLLLLEARNLMVALHVSKVDGILNLGERRAQPIGRNETFNDCIVGRVADRRGDTIYVLSREEFLLVEEGARVNALETMRKQRLGALQSEYAHAG